MIYNMVEFTMLVNGTKVIIKRDDIRRISERDDGNYSVSVSEGSFTEPEKLRFFVITEKLHEIKAIIEASMKYDFDFEKQIFDAEKAL